VLVRFFAVLRERRGRGEERVPLQSGDTPARVFARLFPAASDGGLRVMYAVDHAYVDPDHPLQAGCELAFIPPLGGG
jgi:molybdopterin converting factor small subunit